MLFDKIEDTQINLIKWLILCSSASSTAEYNDDGAANRAAFGSFLLDLQCEYNPQ
jgi:hypothetical protein